LLVAAAALAGCSVPQVPLARFADATPMQLERAYSASSGEDLFTFFFLGTLWSGRNDTSCPSIVTMGQDTTVSGGCTAEDGSRVEGSIALHNVPGSDDNPAYDPSQPSTIDFAIRGTSPENEYVAYNGRIERDPSGISGDLTIDAAGILSISHLTLVCDVDGTCTASPSSEILISELGGASVEGTWSVSGPQRGRVIVRGADVLTFDVSGRDEDGCTPYTIGDKSGTVCVLGLDP
jgi:hypothetical protein